MTTIIKGSAFLKNVNLRCESHGDDKVPACDLSFKMDIDSESLENVAGNDSKWLILALFHEDTGTPRLYTFRSLELNNSFENYSLSIEDGIDLESVEVNNFKISELKDNQQAVMSFRVQITPSKEHVAWLFENQEEILNLTLAPRQSDMFDEGENTEDGDAD